MSYAIDAATRLHHRQLEAATQVQDLLIKAFGGLTTLADKAPQPPAPFTAPFEKVAAPLEKVTAPVAKFVGTRIEFADYVGQSRRDWSDLRTRFQDAIADRRSRKAEVDEAVEPVARRSHHRDAHAQAAREGDQGHQRLTSVTVNVMALRSGTTGTQRHRTSGCEA